MQSSSIVPLLLMCDTPGSLTHSVGPSIPHVLWCVWLAGLPSKRPSIGAWPSSAPSCASSSSKMNISQVQLTSPSVFAFMQRIPGPFYSNDIAEHRWWHAIHVILSYECCIDSHQKRLIKVLYKKLQLWLLSGIRQGTEGGFMGIEARPSPRFCHLPPPRTN